MIRGVAGSGGGGLTPGTTVITGGAAYAVLREDGSQVLAADTNLTFGGAAAGTGLKIVGGTATTDVPALSVTRTNNNSAVATGVKIAFTDTASASTFEAFSVYGGTAADKRWFGVFKGYVSFGSASGGTNFYITQGAFNGEAGFGGSTTNAGQNMYLDGNTNILRGKSTFIFGWSSTSDPTAAADSGVSRVSAGVVGVGTGAAGSVAGTISAAAFISGGSAGVDFGPGAVTSITVKKGIITAIS